MPRLRDILLLPGQGAVPLIARPFGALVRIGGRLGIGALLQALDIGSEHALRAEPSGGHLINASDDIRGEAGAERGQQVPIGREQHPEQRGRRVASGRASLVICQELIDYV